MSNLEQVPASERIHIGFFGARNAGKSSLVNAITGQEISIVSSVAGTTTDAVSKSMELLPLGAVLITDTAGYDDDDAALGRQRIEKSRRELFRTDIAVLVADAAKPLGETEQTLIQLFEQEHTPYLIALNKSDALSEKEILKKQKQLEKAAHKKVYVVSAIARQGIWDCLSELNGYISRQRSPKKETENEKTWSPLN